MTNLPFYLSLDDVILIPNHSPLKSRNDVSLSWKLGSHQLTHPIIATNMDTVTGVDMGIAMTKTGSLAILPRFDAPTIQVEKVRKIKQGSGLTAASVGIKDGEKLRLEMLVDAGIDHIVIDAAHGHLDSVVSFVKTVRKTYPKLNFSAGIVCTYEGAMDLFQAGADVVWVGVGAGATCTTRVVTGCGVPQFTAISDAARAARESGKMIWSCAGSKNSGDIVKCLAAGATAVATGYLLAGTDEAPPPVVENDGKFYKAYSGSTSYAEKDKHLKNDSTDKNHNYAMHIEGVQGLVPYKGPVQHVVDGLLAGIRSGFSYCGARNIEELWKNARFAQISSASVRENGAHDIVQTS